ncbi:uncharacterized protein LOC143154441 [Ptiloglossa arizonensis]|uniref:uncharacterized protein LOC143154441 n=1 Tax=Ptiloglossa arizonensis TaxID=3350558 RepID=UPI003FA13AB3
MVFKAARADRLAEKLGEALAPRGVRVARPTKSAELRVCGLDDSVTREEVARALAQAGGCSEGDIRTGEVRRSSSGLGAVWARCPLPAARKLEAVGRIVVGWVSARIEVLAQRPLQCYRCLETGHVRQRCTSAVDRSGACYRCGAEGHRASHCAAAPKCPLSVPELIMQLTHRGITSSPRYRLYHCPRESNPWWANSDAWWRYSPKDSSHRLCRSTWLPSCAWKGGKGKKE